MLLPMKSHLVETLSEPINHFQGTLPGDHCAKNIAKLKGVLAEVLYYPIAPIDYRDKTPASRMSKVVDLAHNLNNGFVQGDF